MYTECDFCLCEIADDVLHEDETGQCIKLNIPANKKHLDTEKRTILQLQFEKFIELFKFKEDAFWMVKKLLVEGEVCFENIINPEKPELGKVGDNAIGLKVPANRFVVGAYIKNVDGDLAGGSGATAKVTVGSNAVTSATAFDTIKGSGIAAIKATPGFNTTEVEVKLTVATADLTAGKLTIGVIYA